MPRTRRWLLAVLVLACVVVAPIQAPGLGFAEELRDLGGQFSSDVEADEGSDYEEPEYDPRLDGIQFPNDDRIKAGFFSRFRSADMLPDPEEYVARDGVGGGVPLDFPEYSSDGTRVFPLASGTFRVSQEFGCVPLDPGYGQPDFCPPDRPSFHTGVDLAADEGTTIYAAATGTVNFAEIDRTSESGNSIIRIIHDGYNSGYITEYYHWNKSYIEAGDYVIAGEPIGEVGSVGYSSGPHLHFGVFDANAGEYVEPLEWLQGSESLPVASGMGGVGGSDGVMQWASLIEAASNKHGIPAALIAAIITVESGGDPEAVSPVGAQGLMQVMPMHLERYGVPKPKWRDPATNIDSGTRLLAELLAANGTLTNAVAHYFGIGCDVLGTCTDEYIAAVYAWYSYYIPIFAGIAVDAGDFDFELPSEPIVSSPSATPTPGVSPSPTPAPSPSPEPTATPDSQSDEEEATPTPGPSPSPTPSPSPSPTPAPSPSPTPAPSPTPEPTATPEPEPTATPEPEPTSTPELPDDVDEPDERIYVEGFDSRWVLDTEAGVILRLNVDDDDLIAMIELGEEPYGLVLSDDAVWVSLPNKQRVVGIDPETNEIAAEVELEHAPGAMIVTDEGLWIAVLEAPVLVLIDTSTLEIIETLDLDIQPCELQKEEDKLLITDCETGEVSIVERSS